MINVGKTIQVICFLISVFQKTGDATIDIANNRKRRKANKSSVNKNFYIFNS